MSGGVRSKPAPFAVNHNAKRAAPGKSDWRAAEEERACEAAVTQGSHACDRIALR